MKTYVEVDIYIHVFLTSALAGDQQWSASRPSPFTPVNHWIGDCVRPRTGLDDVKRREFFPLLGLELQPLDRLRYPGSTFHVIYIKILLILTE
jgi:hypothetical protein